MSIGGHQSARMKNDEWLTPPELIRALGEFDLDPCSPIVRPWDTAKFHYDIRDDGLKQYWHGRVWLNPPYGKETGLWLRRLERHGNGIALIFARTETEMFFEHVWNGATALKFIKGRLHFHHVDGRRADANSGAPSVLVAYCHENGERLWKSDIEGRMVWL